jgi:hypothetical protein
MRENGRKFIFGASLAGLLCLTSAAFAQKKPATPAPAAKPAISAAAEQSVPAVVDGRTVEVVSGGPRLSADSITKIQAAFNRRLPRDLRTYAFGEIISAAEAAAAEGTTTASAAKPISVCVDIFCCPFRVTISIPCPKSAR